MHIYNGSIKYNVLPTVPSWNTFLVAQL